MPQIHTHITKGEIDNTHARFYGQRGLYAPAFAGIFSRSVGSRQSSFYKYTYILLYPLLFFAVSHSLSHFLHPSFARPFIVTPSHSVTTRLYSAFIVYATLYPVPYKFFTHFCSRIFICQFFFFFYFYVYIYFYSFFLELW